MKQGIEWQVTSPKWSKKLAALGVKQDGSFYWVRRGEMMPWVVVTINEVRGNHDDTIKGNDHFYEIGGVAYSVAELDRMITLATDGDYCCVDDEDCSMGYQVEMGPGKRILHVIPHEGILDERPADCRAKLLHYLHTNGLISVDAAKAE